MFSICVAWCETLGECRGDQKRVSFSTFTACHSGKDLYLACTCPKVIISTGPKNVLMDGIDYTIPL